MRTRELTGVAARITNSVALFAALTAVVYVSGILSYSGVYVNRVTYLGIMLASFLALVFLLYPATAGSSEKRVPWYDIILLVLAIAGPLYYSVFYPLDIWRIESGLLNQYEVILTLFSILTILEATRRVIGLAMPLVASFFFLHGMFCNYFPGILHGRGYDLTRVTTQAYLSNFGVFGVAFDVAATIVIMFILFGQFLQKSGGGAFITNTSLAVLGRVRGGPAQVAVLGSSLFGMISGMSTANIATTGTFTIPLMKSIGYRSEFAGAVEAVASNGGQIMPPVMGSVAFIMAEWLGVPYISICIAALVPAIIYYVCVFTMVDAEAVSSGLKGIPKEELPSLKKVFQKGWEWILPGLLLVYMIGRLHFSPEISGFYALLLVIILSLFRKENRPTSLESAVKPVKDGVAGSLTPAAACASSGVITGCLGLTGLGIKLSAIIVDVSGGTVIIVLLLSALACFILGMGMGAIASYIMVVTLIAPALINIGVIPLAAHLFVFFWAITSYLTPPVAVGAYVAAGIAGANPWKTGWLAVRLGILTFILPFIFVYSPVLIAQGPLPYILLSAVTAIIGSICLGWGLAGYINLRLRLWERVLIGLGGIGLLLPGWATDVLGIILVTLGLIRAGRLITSSLIQNFSKKQK